MTGRFADIIIDISSEQVDRLFTYRIPDGMTLTPGQRVEVPFGRLTREGFVIELKDECGLDPQTVRLVARTLEDYPVILPELIELSRWMKKRYHCNLVDGLRQMIPSQMRGGRVREKQVAVARLIVSGDALEEAVQLNRRAKKRLEVIASADDTEPTSDERHGIGQGVVLGTATDERDEVFSYLWDMPAVYAAFRAAYRMDLYTETLHLWQFDALFDALPENSTLRQTMALRAIHPEDAADDETRVMLAAQKLACRIPDYAELCRIASGQQDV